jgi:predicted dehydrogenase
MRIPASIPIDRSIEGATQPMNPTHPLRHAVIGVGAGVLGMHLPALALESVQVVGATDVDAERGRGHAEELGCPFFVDHRRLLAETRPDVAVVLTPHPFHAPIAIDCLEAGCHVLVEKPMAVHVAEADAMIAAAERADRLLAVNFQQRFRPEVQTARRLIDNGQLGQIQRVELVETWTRTAAYYKLGAWRGTWAGEGGGVLLNQAPHGLDLLCYLAGMPSRLVAWTRRLIQKIETEDTAHAMLEWSSGALGTVHISTAEAGQPQRLEIHGTAGALRVERGGLVVHRFDSDLREFIAHSPEPFAAPASQPVPVEIPAGAGNHLAVYHDLHRAIREAQPLDVDGVSARRSLELANAMIYSSYTGQQVQLPLDRQAYLALLERLKHGTHPPTA